MAWGEGEPAGLVAGLSNVIAIAAGGDHALAIRSGPPAPVLTVVPRSQYPLSGASVTFTAQGRGRGVLQYQWQFNGANISGATGTSLALVNAGPPQEGNYQVALTDSDGSITSPVAMLTLLTPPGVVAWTQPTQQVVWCQSNVVLSVTVTGLDQAEFPLGYQWQLNGTNIVLRPPTCHLWPMPRRAGPTRSSSPMRQAAPM